jgi:hypothetical protein
MMVVHHRLDTCKRLACTPNQLFEVPSDVPVALRACVLSVVCLPPRLCLPLAAWCCCAECTLQHGVSVQPSSSHGYLAQHAFADLPCAKCKHVPLCTIPRQRGAAVVVARSACILVSALADGCAAGSLRHPMPCMTIDTACSRPDRAM